MDKKKQDPYICCLQENHFETRDTYRLKVKGWKKIFHANRDQKKAGVAILISDKIHLKTKAVKRDKEFYFFFSNLDSFYFFFHWNLQSRYGDFLDKVRIFKTQRHLLLGLFL